MSAAATDQEWGGRTVLVTGHMGFKGAWLCLLLARAGATVTGFGLRDPDTRLLFDDAAVGELITSIEGDVRDVGGLAAAFARSRPHTVFHLAAESLVRRSYAHPRATFETNVLGTANVLEAVRGSDDCRAVVAVTTDKCYHNDGRQAGYHEDDALGGADPYSASKAGAELVVGSYRSSFFAADDAPLIATARSGNVIGGGDWSLDRLVPDAIRAWSNGLALTVRNPSSTRPWLHVLDSIAGYTRIATRLGAGDRTAATAWNLGPDPVATATVEEVLGQLERRLPGGLSWRITDAPQPPEARLLQLDSSRARSVLGWSPALDLGDAVAWTADMYAAMREGGDARRLVLDQIAAHERTAAPC
jgi:CDP-glucose 4,6-dehydratase